MRSSSRPATGQHCLPRRSCAGRWSHGGRAPNRDQSVLRARVFPLPQPCVPRYHDSMSAIPTRPQRHAISAAEYLRMGEAGVFATDARLELMDGEIIEMAPIGSAHAAIVNALNDC